MADTWAAIGKAHFQCKSRIKSLLPRVPGLLLPLGTTLSGSVPFAPPILSTSAMGRTFPSRYRREQLDSIIGGLARYAATCIRASGGSLSSPAVPASYLGSLCPIPPTLPTILHLENSRTGQTPPKLPAACEQRGKHCYVEQAVMQEIWSWGRAELWVSTCRQHWIKVCMGGAEKGIYRG